MARAKTVGNCHVCGHYGELSEEHVPPKRAFNDRPYIELTFDEAIKLGPEDVPTGPKRQGGVRNPTLCRNCNNHFGGWYARSFVDWCYQGMDILRRSGGEPKLIYTHHIYPLRVIKQIAAMFFSVNSERFRETDIGSEMSWLLLNKREKGLPKGVRFFAYFNLDGQFRYHPITVRGDYIDGSVSIFTEITYPPFGYVMALETGPPDYRLFDITHFATFDFEDERAMFLDLPVLPTYMGTIPGDYRALEEIVGLSRHNESLESGEVELPPATVGDQLRLLETLEEITRLDRRLRG